MVHIIEDEDGAPLPQALQADGNCWNNVMLAIDQASEDYGPKLPVLELVARTEEAMRRIAPLCLPVEEPPVSRPMRGGYPG